MSSDLARRWWPLVAGILAGIVIAIPVSLLGSTSRKAEAKVLITSPAGTAAVRPLLGNLRELATSGVVAGNVKSTLRLPESAESLRRHLDASVRPGSEVIAITATDSKADRARQLTQEAAVVFGQLVEARFGKSTPELHAAGLDSANVLSGPDRHFLRNGLIGALVGILLGSAAMFVLASGRRGVVVSDSDGDGGDLSEREDVLEQRLKTVTARERALGEQAGKLAALKQQLDQRAATLTTDSDDLNRRIRDIASGERELTVRASQSFATPEPEPEPGPEPDVPAPPGAWNLNDLQRAVDASPEPIPEQLEEWRTYLFLLRQHAGPDGSLPRSFDSLVAEIFGEAVARSTGTQ